VVTVAAGLDRPHNAFGAVRLALALLVRRKASAASSAFTPFFASIAPVGSGRPYFRET
jgi:hypothetical protein